MTVYVGGMFDRTPVVVARSLERAMQETLAFVVGKDDGFEQQWTCGFVDGDPEALRCTMTVEVFGQEHRLYIERYDVDDTEPTLG